MGSKDTEGSNEDEEESLEYDTEDDVELLDGPPVAAVNATTQNSFGPPASISLSRPPAFGDSLGSPSVARMPGGYEQVASRPYQSSNWSPPHIKAVYIDSRQIRHVVVLFLLPSGVAVVDSHDFRFYIKVFGMDHYITLEIEWPETFDKDNGELYLDQIKTLQLKKLKKAWMDISTINQTKKAERDFERDCVVRSMAVQAEMIRYRNSKRATVLRSETQVKLDFPVERLTDNNWWLLGDGNKKTGGGNDGHVRIAVVDLEEASPEEHRGQSEHRGVEMIGGGDDDDEY